MYTTCPHCGGVLGKEYSVNNNMATGTFCQPAINNAIYANNPPFTYINPAFNACASMDNGFSITKRYIATTQADGSVKYEEQQ